MLMSILLYYQFCVNMFVNALTYPLTPLLVNRNIDHHYGLYDGLNGLHHGRDGYPGGLDGLCHGLLQLAKPIIYY